MILGMMASMLPWAPIVAFMVASPLTSPEELVYSAGLFGWPFAWAFFISSIVLGLSGGLAAEIMDRRGWLKNQARMDRPSPHPLPAGAREKNTMTTVPAETRDESTITTVPARARERSTITNVPARARVKRQTAVLAAMKNGPDVNRWELATVGRLKLQPQGENAGSKTCGCSDDKPAEAAVHAQPAACGCSGAAAEQTPGKTGGCSGEEPDVAVVDVQPVGCGCSGTAAEQAQGKPGATMRVFWKELFSTGKRLLIMFTGFAFIGFLLNGLIPTAWVAAIFGQANIYSVPLAATLGLPLYINTEGSLPLVRGLIDGGMSQGAALAFLVTGAGTSFGAVAGALTIARWRVIALVVGTLWVGAVVLGFAYNFILATHLF